MSYLHNGRAVQVSHPIQRVSVNQFKVIFFDDTGHNSIQFNNSVETKRFISWLFENTGKEM